MKRWVVLGALLAAMAGQASAETIALRCRQELSEVYSMGRTGMVSMVYDEGLDVIVSLDTETDRATLAPNVGMFDVGDAQVLIMMVSDQLKEVWDIDRLSGRAIIIAYLVDDPRTVFIRREGHCDLPAEFMLQAPAQ